MQIRSDPLKLKWIVIGSLIFFFIISFFIDLPPGKIFTDFIEFTFPFSVFITDNLFNSIFFSTIIGIVAFLIKRNTNSNRKYSSELKSLDYELKMLINEEHKRDGNSKLTNIKGIGEKRASLLKYAGVKTVSDLAKRSPQNLAEKTGIPITLISEWIIKANKMKK